jgi:hypothetical protein
MKMSEAKAKVSVWKDICKKVAMEGQTEKGGKIALLNSMLISVEKDKATIYGSGEGKAAFVFLEYNIKASGTGVIPISNIDKFSKYLGRFNSSDEISVKADEKATKLVIERDNPKKSIRVRLEPKESVEESSGSLAAKGIFDSLKPDKKTGNFLGTDKFSTCVRFTGDAKTIQGVTEDGDLVSRRIYPFVAKDNKLEITVGDESSGVISNVIPGTVVGKDAKSVFTTGLGGVFDQIDGQCDLWFGDTTPLIVHKKDKEFEVKYIVLPNKKVE